MTSSGTMPEKATALLRQWAHLGIESIVARQQRQQWKCDWTPALRLIEAARDRLLLESERLCGVLERCDIPGIILQQDIKQVRFRQKNECGCIKYNHNDNV